MNGIVIFVPKVYRMNLRLIFLIVALVFDAAVSYAGIIVPRSDLERFSNDQICSFYEDDNGAVWFNNSNTLYRFNGIRAESVLSPVPSRRITGNGKNLWLLSFLTLVRMDTVNENCSFFRSSEVNMVESTLCAVGDSVLLAYGAGIYTPRGDSLELVHVVPEGETLTCLLSLRDGRLLAGTKHGFVYCIDRDGSLNLIYRGREPLSELFEDSAGRIWLGFSSSGFSCLSPSFITLFHYSDATGHPSRDTRTFCEDENGNVYAGGVDGMYMVAPDGRCSRLLLNGIPDRPVCQLYTDKKGGVWAGTYYDGIFYSNIADSPLRGIASDGGSLRLVKAVAEDPKGDIWCFTDGCGIFRFNPQKEVFRMIEPGKQIKFQCAYYDFETSDVWAGEYKGSLICFNTARRNVKRIAVTDTLGRNVMESIRCITGDGRQLLIGGDHGIWFFDPKKETSVSRKMPGVERIVYSFCFDQDNPDILWVGSNGLFRYSMSKQTLEPFAEGYSQLRTCKCAGIVPDGDGGIIVGTAGFGVVRIRGEQIEYFTDKTSGLYDNFVSNVAMVSQDVVAVSTRSGLSMLDMDKHICMNYHSGNGLMNTSFRSCGCMFECQDGTVLIGGKDGVERLLPEKIRFSDDPVPFGLDYLYVNNARLMLPHPIPDGYEVELNYRQTNFTANAALFDHKRINSCVMQYMLEGFDSGWKDFSPETPINYMNMAPGRYVLRVRAARSMSTPFTETSLKLIIHPAWYASTPARVIEIILLIAIIASILSLLYSRILLHERLKSQERENAERTRLFINISHRLRTPLTLVIGQLEYFFRTYGDKFPGRKNIETSYRHAKDMSNIISEFVDIENNVDAENGMEQIDTAADTDVRNPLNPYSMLIVDDNADIRSHLRTVFSSSYEIIEAKDGAEGLVKAKKMQPDIIISDVQMPIMDGITMCSELRQNYETSHIPIILLTAHASEKHNQEGILAGADDYITKPFSLNLLEAKCRNLIRSRKQLKDHYSLPGNVDASRRGALRDSRYLNSVIGAVERNLHSGDIGVPRICSELGISKTSLTSNLKRITGMTPRAFIEDIKLQHAARMLRDTSMPINAISDSLGFSDPKYFTLCFKRKYACTPTAYRQTN